MESPRPVPTPLAPPNITRRDLLHGLTLGGAATAWPATARAGDAAPEPAADTATDTRPGDPPLRTGLQGQTDELAARGHTLRDAPGAARDGIAERDEAVEDLVVVGAGLSGLAGAWLYQRHAERHDGRPPRILLLEALDDLGGHARRNEFTARSGQRLVGYGGSQSLDSPGLFSPAVHGLLRDVGIELQRFETEFYDQGWAQRHGLVQQGQFYGREAWGRDRLVRRQAGEAPADWLARTPLPAAAQADLVRLMTEPRDVLPGLSRRAKRARLAAMSYASFLGKLWRVDAAVLRYHANSTHGYFGVGIEATSALDAWAAGLPGFDGLGLGEAVDARMSPSGRQLMASRDAYIYHFPDGNAGVARALLRALMPGAMPGDGMASLAHTRLAYERLDEADAPVRLRLRAPVVGLRHLGPPASAELVEVRYLDAAGTLRAVRARQVLLACWHRVIPRLTDELPSAQVHALEDQVKVPLLYANVLLSNWRAWQRAGLDGFRIVDGFWEEASLDFPVNMGRVHASAGPDEPILVHLGKVVLGGATSLGQAPRAQAAAGRARLAGWSFSQLEDQIRAVLSGALEPFGFDGDREIEAITINRWAHGYAYEYMRPWDTYWPGGPLPCVRARRGWGRVAIANSDAGAYAYAHSAIDQATRAVQELLPRARLPAWRPVPGPDPKALRLG